VLSIALASVVPATAQQPRLPPRLFPGATIQSLANDTSVEAMVLRSRLLSEANRFKESAASWKRVGDREPLLAAMSLAESVRASLDAGDLQIALDGIAILPAPVPADILLRSADASRSAGRLDGASALYIRARAAAGRTSIADQAALGLAATMEQAGDPADALDVLRELQLTFRQPAAYDAADAGARRLSAQLNNAEPLIEADYEAISGRLTNAAAFRRSVDVLNDWRAHFPDTTRGARIDYAIVQNLYALRANDEARRYAESVVKKYGPGAEAASAARTLFSLDVREGKTPDVERHGYALLRGEVTGTTLEQRLAAGRQLAEYLLSAGQPTRAVGVFDQLYRLTRNRGDRIDLSWRIAIASLRSGNRPRAILQLRQLRKLKLDSETERATDYWLGFALDGSGGHAEALAVWGALVRRYPFSYYGGKAALKLGGRESAATLTFPELTLSDAVTSHPDYRTAELLARAGLLQEAATYARRLTTVFRQNPVAGLLAARAAEAADDPSASATIMSAYFGEYLERPALGLPDDFGRLAYPLAYWTDVSAAAARHHVDPLLMVALARQESHFDRTVKSPVGAIGLFQIMPYTAVQLDPAFQIERAGEQLVKPEVAAELAARLLEQNLTRFHGALAPAIASYNADIERVQTWWDAAKGLQEELFVDSIPYLQTRAYVRQVLANYAMYQRFDGPPASRQK
jgi:soluble lytic murein transglycosylase